MPSSLLKVLFHKGLGWANEYADIHCICITILDWKYYSRVLTFIWDSAMEANIRCFMSPRLMH